MLPRSARKPALISLGAAAILAAGAVPVLAVPPAPQPEAKTSVASKDVKVVTEIAPGEGGGFTGVTVTVSVEPLTELSVDCPGDIPESPARTCDLSSLAADAEATVTATVGMDDDITKDTPVTLKVTVTRGNAKPETGETEILFTPIPKTPPPSPTPTPTKSSPKPKPTPSNTKSSSDSNNNDDDNDSGSGGSSGSSSSGSGSGSGSSYTPPLPNASLQAPPQVTAPSQAGPPLPNVAPQASPTPESRLRNNKAPVAQDLTFERMASTQIAWLAALLVAFSLLMTQLRLGRKHGAPARALAGTGRRPGSHRRPRKGLFSK